MKRFLRINRMALGEARTHTRFIVIVNILLGFGCMMMTMSDTQRTFSDLNAFGYFLFICAGAIGATAVIGVFRDMNSIQHSDVQFSLPMSSLQRYTSKILALGYVHVFPVLIWAGLTCILRRFIQGPRAYGWGSAVTSWLTVFLIYAALVLFWDCVAVICAICCGRRAETRYFTYIAAICLSVLPLIIREQLMERWAGHSGQPGIGFFFWTGSIFVWDRPGEIPHWILIVNCLISLAVIAAMFLVYRRRDAGAAGRPVSNRIFFETVMFAGVMTMLSMAAEGLGTIIIIAGVVYLIIHIVTFRERLSGGKILHWTTKYLVSVLLFLLLNAAGYLTNGFGAAYYLPSESELDKAYIVISVDRDPFSWSGRGAVAYIRGDGGRDMPIYDSNTGFIVDHVKTRLLLADEKKEAVRIVQRYIAGRKKSFTDFLERSRLSGTYYDGDGVPVNILIYRPMYGEDKVLIRQSMELSEREVSAMLQELEESGLVYVTRDVYFNSYYYDKSCTR